MGEISIKFHVEAFQADLKRIDRATNRATMWGLREVGRQLKRAEKSKVPVYKGPGGVKRLPTWPPALRGRLPSQRRLVQPQREIAAPSQPCRYAGQFVTP